ncbi:hypothetical protein BD324DRAFT_650237 [Kockovaella imperatae]|uniref:Small ribosomal subunit protein mS33 n=1 Tax=Kockovaella imperatae TaxID=4999 RepID=A0A1Y1UI30_9TREE|nr:hypothetical protein BD324DRAFT_650237 [Kockovaella imperatae]ORX37682.1 hypothetical protein BD324DRAFT_650237 [Kockovaella imperatae]
MPPQELVVVPKTIHNVLNQMRSKIFMTAYNPTGARQGTKYLRKKPMGQKFLEYYPDTIIRPSQANSSKSHAMYPGWTGLIPGIPYGKMQKATFKEKPDTVPGPSKASIATSSPASPDASVSAPSSLEGAADLSTVAETSSSSSSSSLSTTTVSSETNSSAATTPQTQETQIQNENATATRQEMLAALKAAGIRPDSMYFGADNFFGAAPPEEYWPTAWQADWKERYRIKKLTRRRRIGKITPKKGEGKRSQLGKGKKK